MAFKVILFPLFICLVAVNLIFADEESDRLFGLPSFDSGNSSGFNLPFAGLFSQLPLPLPFPFSLGSRQERSAEHQETEENNPQNRVVLGTYVSCNYSTQGRTACSNCRQSLACYANNAGRVRTCTGLLRYCNNGRCSFIPGELCTNTTAG